MSFLDPLLIAVATPVLLVTGRGMMGQSSFRDFQCIDSGDALVLSGTGLSSGEVISKITRKQRQHDLVLTIHTVLAGIPHPLCFGKKLSGSLCDYRVNLPPTVDRVLINGDVIWQRGQNQ